MDTFTESVTFNGPTDFHDATGTTAGPGGNTLYFFDSNGGTLDSVTVTYQYNLYSTITLTNTSNISATGTAYTASTPQFGASDAAVSSVLAQQNTPVDGGTSTYSLAPGASSSFSSNGSENAPYTFTYTDASTLAAFSRAGGGTFTPLLSTTTGVDLFNSGGNVTDSQQSMVQPAGYVISYNYTNGTTVTPTITSESASPKSTPLDAGKVVTFTIATNEAVTATGSYLTLSNGATAAYSASSTSTSLVYTYTVGSTDTNTSDLQATKLNGTITDGAGNTLDDTTFTPIDTKDAVDTTAPTVTSVILGKTAYGVGSTVTATIQLSGTYDGNGAYTLGSGSTIDGAALTAGTYNAGSNTLTASFQVTANTNEVIQGNVPVDVTVDDAVGNPSMPYTTPVGNETIDTHPPTAVSVSGFMNSPSDDTGKSPAAAGSTVGALTTTDASPGDMFTYTLGGADKGDFTIANNTLEVGNTALTDGTVYNLTVTSTDLGGNQYTQMVQVTGATTPTVTSIVPAGMNPTNSPSDPFTVTFSQSVQGVTAANFNLTGTDRNGTIGTPTTADGGTTWTVPVTGVSGNGALGLELYNPNGIASTSTDTPLADETTESDPDYTIDTTSPTTYPASLTVTENSGPTPIGIQAPSDTETYTITAGAQPTDGTVTLANGTPVQPNETLSTADLTGLEFTPTPGVAGQSSTFTYSVKDQAGNSSTGTATLDIYSNPAITGLADSTTNLQDPTRPFASATVSDATQGATDSVTIALSGAAGTLSGTGLTANPNGTYTLGSASPAAVTQELDALTFTPSPADGGPIETTDFALTVTSSTKASSTASVTSTIDSTPNAPLFGAYTNSPSSVGGQVYALYQTILGRAPDPLGFETQVAAVEAGASLESVAQGLLTSAEYANDYGATVASNAGFINQLYEDGLHRPADAAGQQLFGTQLANGTSRAQVAVEIATSQESQNDLAPTFANGVFVPDASDSAVARLFYGLLDRAPDAGGLQADENAVNAGTTIGQIIQGMLGSQEYQTTTVGQDNLDFIQNLYQTALNRPGDAAGLQLYENGLDTGSLSRAQVADDFLTGTEFQTDEAGQSNATYVNAVYEAALGRAADPNGSSYFQNLLNNGVSRSQVAEDIVGSAEFASKYTAPGQAEFVTQLYEGALGRAPAAGEVQGWQTALNSGASLATVAASITQSPEAQSHLVPKIEAGYHIA